MGTANGNTNLVFMVDEAQPHSWASKIFKFRSASNLPVKFTITVSANRATVDPTEIRDQLARKFKTPKVELILPVFYHQVVKVVLKLSIPCQCAGCFRKIEKLVSKTRGVSDMCMDKGSLAVITFEAMLKEIKLKALVKKIEKKFNTEVEVAVSRDKQSLTVRQQDCIVESMNMDISIASESENKIVPEEEVVESEKKTVSKINFLDPLNIFKLSNKTSLDEEIQSSPGP